MQEDFDMDYQVEGTLQEVIDMTDEAIVMCSVKPLHSKPINELFMVPPEV